MSVFDKLVHRVKGALNDTLDNTEDLGASARQSVRDLDEDLLKAESALLDVRAEVEILNGKRVKAQTEVDKWLKAASNAAGKDDNLARECLQKKASASGVLIGLVTQIDAFAPTVKGIEAKISELRSKKDNLSNQADLIGVRSEVADVETRAAEILGGVGGTNVSLASVEESLARKEARAHASTSILSDKTGESLEARVAALDSGTSIEDELAQLKKGK